MKITDFALIFIGITLPIIIIVYVNVSFTIKAVQEEIYYQKLIDSAVSDASQAMKEVENEDKENDYGYSGTVNNKVSVNAQVATDTFFNSLYSNLSIKGNTAAELYLKYFVPVIAVVDYNGVYISSIEEYLKDGQNVTDYVVHPKRYFSYTYGIDSSGNVITDLTTLQIKVNNRENGFSLHNIEFSTDDYIVHRGERFVGGVASQYQVKGFYITDKKNNGDSYDNKAAVETKVENLLTSSRQDTIVDVVTSELTYAVNAHNHYARVAGINYAFSFPYTTKDEMYRYVSDIGMLAFVQGISVGNKYLNYKSYGSSSLTLTTKYYLSTPTANSKFPRNLYHKDKNCPEYQASNHTNITPEYVTTKQQASSAKASLSLGGISQYVEGFYPCPICNP